MDLRRRIVAEFEKGAGRHDDPAVYGGTPGDPGLIGPDSVSWEINADLASVSQAGLPAIVLEILHPSVVAGVQDLSNYREDPFQRARATLGYVLTTTFGNTEAATAAHRARQARACLRQGDAPGRRAVPRAGPRVDRLGAHVHSVDDHACLRTHETATVATGTGPLPGRAGGDRPDGRRRVGADDRRRTRRVRRRHAATTERERTDAGVHRLPDDIAVLPQPARPGRPPAAPLRDLRGHEPRPAVGARADRLRPAFCADPHADRAGTANGRAQVALGVRHTALSSNWHVHA